MRPLWPHQEFAVTAVPQAFADGHRRVCLTSPTGGGKTDIVMNLTDLWSEMGKKVAIYTNRRLLIEQLFRDFSKYGIDAGVRSAGYDHEYWPVQICSVQTANARVFKSQKWDLHRADLVVIDECFVGDTMIDTPQGPKRIDAMRRGDPIYCATGIGYVMGTHRNYATTLLHLEFSNGQHVTCTRDHPFFTGDGWIEARRLVLGQVVFGRKDLSGLWGSVLAKKVSADPNVEHGYVREPLGQADVLLHLLLKEALQPDVRGGPQGEDASDNPAHWASTEAARWKREAATVAAIQLACGPGGWLVSRVCGPDQNEATEGRPANVLQDRCCESDAYDRGRGGWPIPYRAIATSSRSAQRRDPDFIRLVRSSSIECDGFTPVCNLQVAGHPSYFANGLLVHNCHVNTGPTCKKIIQRHTEDGAKILGITATPLDLEGLYEHLIVAGTTSELRDCGALVQAVHYGPDEPDLKAFAKELAGGKDLSEAKAEKAMMTNGIFGRVLEWYGKLNPEHKPTILFAPSVGSSLWFAQQFWAAGISAGHIDGEEVWINGEFCRDGDARTRLADDSRERRVKVVCNRFVLREGVNWPWLAHGVLATVFGSLQSFLQSGGRLLRKHDGLDSVTVQDHGGNWWRHGSLNADRQWDLGMTANSVAQLRADSLRQNPVKQPFRCPACGAILTKSTCACGFEVHTKSRPVVQIDGTLKEMKGDVFKPRRVATWPSAEADWKQTYYRARNSRTKMTFFQAEALYAGEHNWNWPSRQWRMMPVNPADMARRVCEVSPERLRL